MGLGITGNKHFKKIGNLWFVELFEDSFKSRIAAANAAKKALKGEPGAKYRVYREKQGWVVFGHWDSNILGRPGVPGKVIVARSK